MSSFRVVDQEQVYGNPRPPAKSAKKEWDRKRTHNRNPSRSSPFIHNYILHQVEKMKPTDFFQVLEKHPNSQQWLEVAKKAFVLSLVNQDDLTDICSIFNLDTGDWICPKCKNKNYYFRVECNMNYCRERKPGWNYSKGKSWDQIFDNWRFRMPFPVNAPKKESEPSPATNGAASFKHTGYSAIPGGGAFQNGRASRTPRVERAHPYQSTILTNGRSALANGLHSAPALSVPELRTAAAVSNLLQQYGLGPGASSSHFLQAKSADAAYTNVLQASRNLGAAHPILTNPLGALDFGAAAAQNRNGLLSLLAPLLAQQQQMLALQNLNQTAAVLGGGLSGLTLPPLQNITPKPEPTKTNKLSCYPPV